MRRRGGTPRPLRFSARKSVNSKKSWFNARRTKRTLLSSRIRLRRWLRRSTSIRGNSPNRYFLADLWFYWKWHKVILLPMYLHFIWNRTKVVFIFCDRRACPSNRLRGYDDSSANSRRPKTAPTSLKATWLWSAPSTAPLSPPPLCPALRCIWCRSPVRSARSENPIHRPAKHFSPPVDIGAQIPVGYKPSRSLSDVK